MSKSLERAKALIDIVSPKTGKAPDFVVLMDPGGGMYIRCLNGKPYSFRPRLPNGAEADLKIGRGECTIKVKNDHPIMPVVVSTVSDLDGDKLVFIDVKPCPGCGEHAEVTIRVPKKRTVIELSLPSEEASGSAGRSPISRRSSIQDILSTMGGGGPGVYGGSVEEMLSQLEDAFGPRSSDRPSERRRRREEPVGTDRSSRSNGDGHHGRPTSNSGSS